MNAFKQYKILYVDDEEHNLVAFKATFRRDYTIFTAKSAKDGFDILKKEKISLIITDQRMPEMTGIQFLEKIIPEYPDIIRIILTGFSDVEAIIEAINTGRVFRYITKPWDEKELKMTIDNAIQLYALQQMNTDILEELQQKINEQERTLRLFQKYVPEEVVQKTLSASEDSILDGELRTVAVLFCDIRGFTQLSERLAPKEVVDFLNTYYTQMTDVIKSHGGMVNQYVGDEIFACFGAPNVLANQEESAVLCALEMINTLETLNTIFEEKYHTRIEVGMGINSGEVVAGNVGSDVYIRYSITGDTVNTGKRIESLTKDIPNTILLNENVASKVEHLVDTRQWEPVRVKGKKEELNLFEITARKS
jgi:class 3 adenylate cyclase